jgi:hypothetical protein
MVGAMKVIAQVQMSCLWPGNRYTPRFRFGIFVSIESRENDLPLMKLDISAQACDPSAENSIGFGPIFFFSKLAI